jgi:hypothetical protein
MADCVVTPYIAQQIASKDTNRIQGIIAKALAVNSPFVNVLNGGIYSAGISDSVRSIIQEQALPGDSLVQPTFTPTATITDVTDNGVGISSENVATTAYSYALATKRGRGPKIPVKGMFSAYKGSYTMAEDALKKLTLQYFNADIRNVLYQLSGVKYVACSSATNAFFDGLTGGQSQIAVPFANIPQANIGPITFAAVHKLARFQHETTLAEFFNEGTNDQHYKFIGGSDIVEAFRNELGDSGVNNTLRAITTGSFKYGEQSLRGYSWESSTAYRGVVFGVDQRPMRATSVVNGVPQFVEPLVGVQTTNGTAARANPLWVTAPYEVAWLIGKDSFERLVPQSYTGEGTFKFSPQLAMGELTWHYQLDNDCNQFGDFGWHLYEITRAYRPVRPHAVLPILFQRCDPYANPVPCTSSNIL